MRRSIVMISLALLDACASLEQDPEHDKASAMRICLRTTPSGIGWNMRFNECVKAYGHP